MPTHKNSALQAVAIFVLNLTVVRKLYFSVFNVCFLLPYDSKKEEKIP